jgi:hypothetical protein
MPRYLLSVWHDAPYGTGLSEADGVRIMAQVGAFNAELEALGALVDGAGLVPPEQAVVARAVDGRARLTDGPHAGPYPAMGGFWIIDVADEDLARTLAERAALACEAPVELRAFQAGD